MKDNNWAQSEFENIDLGDKRLNSRLIKIAGQLVASPESPINKACENWGGTKAAYRFFQNDSVNYKSIVAHHAQRTKSRAENEEVVLAIQDTTYFNYTHHPKTSGLGLLSRYNGSHKEVLTKGLYMHSTLAVTAEGLPLGILDQKISTREVLPKEMTRKMKKAYNSNLPIEEKESFRWLESMRSAHNIFSDEDKKVVTIADREADIYDLMLLADELGTHYLIRASRNRKVNKTSICSENSGEMVWDCMEKKTVQGQLEIEVPKSEEDPARTAVCSIRFGKIKMLPTRFFNGDKSKNRKLELDVDVVYVKEEKPPKGVKKIEWMLYTSIPVHCFDDALEKVRWYCLRWRIEVYFKVIKSGFNVEKCRLETAERLIRYLSVISVVAWRVFWLTMVARYSPNEKSSSFLSDEEWKVLFVKFSRAKKIPQKPPSIKEAVFWIARLGGFLARKGDGFPGITHVWRGLKKLTDMVIGLRLYADIYG